jgi:hypothetical protein
MKEYFMREELLEKLRPITEEERKILEDKKEIQKDIYTATEEFKIDGRKMLEKGRVIDIRTHTRFVAFPQHSHNFIEILYMCEGHTLHKIDGTTEIELKAGELLLKYRRCGVASPAGERFLLGLLVRDGKQTEAIFWYNEFSSAK